VLVLAPGSVSRLLPVPGLAENSVGFKTVAEAIHLRNHVLGQLDAAAALPTGSERRALLTLVFVGGGCGGVEAMAELADMARAAGVAQIYGIRMRGPLAWLVHRIYQLPMVNRRLRVLADWTLALAFPREIVSLGALEHAHADFEAAAATVPPDRMRT
jgi:NADH dehydrogenase FAD-containing subunit